MAACYFLPYSVPTNLQTTLRILRPLELAGDKVETEDRKILISSPVDGEALNCH